MRQDAQRIKMPQALLVVGWLMSEAIKYIVNGYVTLKNREALEELRAHRMRLRKQLKEQPSSWIDPSQTIRLYEDDLQAIEDGLSRLN